MCVFHLLRNQHVPVKIRYGLQKESGKAVGIKTGCTKSG